MPWGTLCVLILVLVGGCVSIRSDLERATLHYEQARYEAVLTWLDELEADLPRMNPADRSTFLYLRGMSAFRLGQRDDATHYLALARESIALDPDSLSASLQSTLERALVVLVSGTSAAAPRFGDSR